MNIINQQKLPTTYKIRIKAKNLLYIKHGIFLGLGMWVALTILNFITYLILYKVVI